MTMPTELPTNQWFVIASVDELGDGPLARTVCGENIVLFRDAEGTLAALVDRCPHRNYPLSLGQVVDGQLQCGYHGLTFSSSGTCVWAPNQSRIPSSASVASYPLCQTGPWIWVWIGDPTHPGVAAPPVLPWLSEPGWAVLHGMEPIAARYGLLVDNLLDLSHETFLHAGYIGTREVAATPIETEVDDATGTVRVSRRMAAVECPKFYSETTGMTSPIDRWQDIEYRPICQYVLHSRIAPAGVAPALDGSDPDAAHLKILYAITPSTAGTTLDFWALCRNFSVDDEGVDEAMADMQRTVVLQDVEALAHVERVLGQSDVVTEVSLKIDSGALAARRVIGRQLEAEPSTAK